MNNMYKILGIIMILAVVSLSGCIGEDVPADNESEVVVIDEPVDIVVDEPVADEPEDVVEVEDPVEDDVVIPSKPSSSGSLVAGVDGTTGHGAEIKAKREAAEAARLAMLNALADDLPNAINASENASLEAFAAEEVYSGACALMNASLESNATLVDANATTLAALDNKTVTQEAFEAMETDLINATTAFGNYNATEETENSTAIYDALNGALVNATEDFNEADEALEDATDAYNDAVDAEADAQEAYDEAREALGALTQEVIDELEVIATESRELADEALAYLEECQAAYDTLNTVVEESEE